MSFTTDGNGIQTLPSAVGDAGVVLDSNFNTISSFITSLNTSKLSLSGGVMTGSIVADGIYTPFSPSLTAPPFVFVSNGYNVERYVSTTGNDSTGDGTSGNPYLTIAQAISVAGPGDAIYLAAGTYDIGNTTLDLAADGVTGIHLIGAGTSTTTIQSSYLLTAGACIVHPGNGSYIGLLTITGTAASTTYQAPLGSAIGQAPFVNVVVDRVNLNAGSDGFYIRTNAGQVCSMNAYECVVSTTYDASNLNMPAGSIVNYYNVTFIANGPSGISGTHISRGVISNSGGRINCYGCSFNIGNASSVNYGAWNNSGDGCLRLYNCSFNTHSNVGGIIYDIVTSNHITYVSNCTGSGTSGALLVSGTGITDPSALAEVTVPSIYTLSMTSDASTIASLTSGIASFTNANITNANISKISIISYIGGISSYIYLNSGNLNPGSSLLQLDGGNLYFANGTGTGATGSFLWMDQAIINMGDGVGGNTYPGGLFNVDQGTIQFDSISNIYADGSGHAIFGGLGLWVDQPLNIGTSGVNTSGTSPLNIKHIPTSSAGLSSGDVWSNGGVLTIVT